MQAQNVFGIISLACCCWLQSLDPLPSIMFHDPGCMDDSLGKPKVKSFGPRMPHKVTSSKATVVIND